MVLGDDSSGNLMPVVQIIPRLIVYSFAEVLVVCCISTFGVYYASVVVNFLIAGKFEEIGKRFLLTAIAMARLCPHPVSE